MDLQSTAFILAGGRSTRMGTDKAFLVLGGTTLLEHAISVAKNVCDSVVLVGEGAKFSAHGLVVEDQYSARGPLAGIHAALTSPYASDLNLVLAVDTPAIPTGVLHFLLETAATSNAAVTVPRANGFTQPLCAIYRRTFAQIADKSLEDGSNKIDPLFEKVETRVVMEQEIRNLGFSPDIFENVNTPADWLRMQQQLGISR